jgi:GR25 family glycosyltransferase involved in LPS biosynthesis
MHKDVGNQPRNGNFLQMTATLKESQIDQIEGDAIYFRSIDEGVDYLYPEFHVVESAAESSVEIKHAFPYAAGALGIYASLIFALKEFLGRGSEYLLVCEDDFKISKKFRQLTNYVILHAPDDWEVLNLFWHPERHFPARYFFKLESALVENFSTSATACYMLNRKSAVRILSDLMSNGIQTNLDWYLFNGDELGKENLPFFRCFQINPFMPQFGKYIREHKITTI